jgi:hypothetical protein
MGLACIGETRCLQRIGKRRHVAALYCAFGDSFLIAFGEVDPPLAPVRTRRNCSRTAASTVRPARHIAARRPRSLITRKSRPRPRSRTPSWRRKTPRRGCWPWSSCGCCCSRRSSSSSRCCSWRSCRRWCYCRRGCTCRCWCGTRCSTWRWCRCGCLSTRKYPNIINIFFVLVSLRVEVKRGGVCHVAAGLVGNDCDVVTYLILIRIAFERIKRIAHCHIRRPGHASVGAKGIK